MSTAFSWNKRVPKGGKDRPRVLSLDWDYFTGDRRSMETCDPECCGWCPGERYRCERKHAHRGLLKRRRAAKYLALRAWDMEGAKLVVAESHGSIVPTLHRFHKEVDIFDYDRHDDCCYHAPGGMIPSFPACYNWIDVARGRGHRVYQKKLGTISSRHRKGPIDLVFLCKSSPYTAEEDDGKFHELIRKLESLTGMRATFTGHRAHQLRKEYRRWVERNA